MEEEQVKNIKKLIVIGGSSGSLDAILVILPCLIKNFSIPILIVLHRGNKIDNGLIQLLAAKTKLHVKEADEKEKLLPGWIYVAPPDYHVLLEEDGSISLDVSEKVHYCRPSIDVTFTSAALSYGKQLTAILLSGANADGAAAMNIIKQAGGMNIVQAPAEAIVSYMPEQAILLAPVDQVLSTVQIAALMNKIASA